jgi:hypothetical protein
MKQSSPFVKPSLQKKLQGSGTAVHQPSSDVAQWRVLGLPRSTGVSQGLGAFSTSGQGVLCEIVDLALEVEEWVTQYGKSGIIM